MTGVPHPRPRVWLGPAQPAELRAAISTAGATLVPQSDANVVVWSRDGTPITTLRDALTPAVEWVQLDSAGVEDWIQAGVIDSRRIWTGAQGAYASDVAEHVVAFILAAVKRLGEASQRRTWADLAEGRLAGRTVGVVGGGGIAREMIRLLRPFRVRVIVVSRSGRPVAGAAMVLPSGQLHDVLAELDYVVLATPLTPLTKGIIGRDELHLMSQTCWLINVGRGPLVDTKALVGALDAQEIGGACLDVTDPEPLPDDHPLWGRRNVIITPHVANPWHDHVGVLAQRIHENLRRFILGRRLLGVISPKRGY